MRMLEKILLATNFGPAARAATDVAAFVSKAFDSRIIPLYVVPEISKRTTRLLEKAVPRRMEALLESLKAELSGDIDRDELLLDLPLDVNR